MFKFLFRKKEKPRKVADSDAITVLDPAVIEMLLYLFDRSLQSINYRVYAMTTGVEPAFAKSASVSELGEHALLAPVFHGITHAEDAARYLLQDVQGGLKSNFWNVIYEIDSNDESCARCVSEARHVIERKDALSDLKAIGINLIDIVLKRNLSSRKLDLANIYEVLERKKEYLLPLLLRAKMSSMDKYGETDLSNWLREISEFSTRFFPDEKMQFFRLEEIEIIVHCYAEGWMKQHAFEFSSEMTGLEFEAWCAAKLVEQGWSAQLTSATGDQGVDIVARRSGLTVAIQCKRYAKLVSNRAVQEVVAGRIHVGASAAAVISTGGFTKSAIQIARTAMVDLIHASQIGLFSDQYGFVNEDVSNSEVKCLRQGFTNQGERVVAALFCLALDLIDLHTLGVCLPTKKRFNDCVILGDETSFVFYSFELSKLIEAARLMLSATFGAANYIADEREDLFAEHAFSKIGIEVRAIPDDQSISIADLIGSDLVHEVNIVLDEIAARLKAQ